MKKIQILFFCLLLTNFLFAQNKNDKYSEKELNAKLADAHYLLLNEEYKKALVEFSDLSKFKPNNAYYNYLTGYCYLKLPFENGRSIPYLLKAINQISLKYQEGSSKEINAPIDALYWLGYAYHLNKGFSPAIEYYKRYRDTLPPDDLPNIKMVERQIESCQNAKLLIKNPVTVEIDNLGNYVNSPKGDFNPCVNGDGSLLLFTRIKEKANKDTNNLNIYTKKEFQILQSTCDKMGRWSKPIDITEQLGDVGDLKTLSVSSDGTQLFLFKDNLEEGGPLSYKNGSIYYSKKENNKWTTAKRLNSNINSIAWESHAAISPNGNELYFTSERDGGFGGLDIYISKMENGDWGPAKNIGSTINTQYDEVTPVILPDGKTLYFSSEGHNNMGGFDIFYSTKIDSTKWGEPVNIGYPINSTDDNIFYVPIEDGSRSFYSVARNEGYFTFGEEDIYELDIVLDSLRLPEIELRGRISMRDLKNVDSTTLVTIKTIDKNKLTETKTIKPNLQTGIYQVKLKPIEYEVIFTKDNYNPETKRLSLKKIRSNTPISLDVTLDPIIYDEDRFITFNKIYFNFNNAALTDEAIVSVDKLYNVMNNNPSLVIEITGHTDSRGMDKHGKELANARSHVVSDYLVMKGIPQIRIQTKGEGSFIKSGVELNRCAEIKILKSDSSAVYVTDVETLQKIKKNNVYLIDVVESKETMPMSSFNSLKEDFPNILGMSYDEGYMYYFGEFTNQTEASIALNIAFTKGFIKSKIIDNFYLNNLNKKDITSRKITNKRYTIQILESKNQFQFKSKTQYIREIRSVSGIYRYYTKDYTTLFEANIELNKQIEAGFKNAFILNSRDIK